MKALSSIIPVVILALAALPVAAEDIHPRAQRLAERLSLDDEQTREISDLMVEHRQAMRERMSSEDQPRGRELRDRLRESREQLKERIRGVLTEEQAETFDQLGTRAGRPAGRRLRENRGERAGREGRLATSNLDAEKREELRALRERQREEIQSLRARHRQEMQALMEDNGQETAGDGDGEDESAEADDPSDEDESVDG